MNYKKKLVAVLLVMITVLCSACGKKNNTDNPDASPNIFASAIPALKCNLGKSLAIRSKPDAVDKSAETTKNSFPSFAMS